MTNLHPRCIHKDKIGGGGGRGGGAGGGLITHSFPHSLQVKGRSRDVCVFRSNVSLVDRSQTGI